MGSSPNAMILSDANNKRTPCTKMLKEEKDVLNGNGDCTSEDSPRTANSNSHGGRLKFFKDGKFILELESAREGERVSWVSVPRKTFWPPQGTASSTPSYRQESSTSLSVSDDNSSIQSSPWQRDHSWKQATPRKNLSKELIFFYCRPAGLRRLRGGRRLPPHDCPNPKEASALTNGPACNKRQSLLTVIQALLDKLSSSSGSPRSETAVVSPRKRILRELDTDCRLLKNVDNGQKRSRGKPASVPSAVIKVTSPVRVNGSGADSGSVTPATPTRPARNNTSYSITSILSEDRKPKVSPAHSPSHFPPGPPSSVGIHQHQQYSAGAGTPTSSEERWFTESVDKLRSIELSHTEAKRLFVPYTCSYMVPPYSYNFPMTPQYYHSPYPRSYAMPIYPLQLPVRPEAPSCSWAAEPTRTETTEHRDENITDMPLNLSKHGA